MCSIALNDAISRKGDCACRPDAAARTSLILRDGAARHGKGSVFLNADPAAISGIAARDDACIVDRSSDIIAHVLAAIAESKRSTRIYGNDAIISGTFELLPVQAERDVPLDDKFACDLFIEIVVPVRERTCRFHLHPVRMLTVRFLRRLSRGRDHHSDAGSQDCRRKSRRNAERPFHSFFHDLFILRMTAPAGTFCRSSRIDRDRQTRTRRSFQIASIRHGRNIVLSEAHECAGLSVCRIPLYHIAPRL